MSWAKDVFSFVTATLPNLLTKHGEGQELEAIQELAQIYRERRTHQLTDRRAEIERDRAEVDRMLADKEASEKEETEKEAVEKKTRRARNSSG